MVATSIARRFDSPTWLLDAVGSWVPLAVALSAVAFIVYAAVQQEIRQSANDPQVALAEAAALRLGAGDAPVSVLPTVSVDMRTSLSSFLIVYDDSDAVAASSVTLNGRTPNLPDGVLDSLQESGYGTGPWATVANTASALLHGEKHRFLHRMPGAIGREGQARFTWQPEPGVRSAAVLTSYSGSRQGFVLAGRLLRETELLEDHIFAIVALGLAAGLGATLLAAVAVSAIQVLLRQKGP